MNNPFEEIGARLSNIETLLLDLKHNPKPEPEKEKQAELLTVQDAAVFLKLSVPTIYTLISKGELPVMKRSKRCYFSKEDLLSYVRSGRKMTIQEIEARAEKHVTGKSL